MCDFSKGLEEDDHDGVQDEEHNRKRWDPRIPSPV